MLLSPSARVEDTLLLRKHLLDGGPWRQNGEEQ